MNLPSRTNRSAPSLPALLLAAALLAGCAGGDNPNHVDANEAQFSRLIQPADPTAQVPQDAGDIAIAGQMVAHALRDLPDIAAAPKPPLVQFAGVTSIVSGPVDTEPYTNLLRDRIILGTREKLRFVERQLPPLTKKGKKAPIGEEEPQYQLLAELRGRVESVYYRVQIQLVDFHSGAVAWNGLYSIRKEAEAPAPVPQPVDASAVPSGNLYGAPLPPPSPYPAAPSPSPYPSPYPATGNGTLPP